MVRPAIGFVKAQTTTCSAFLLGQAQDVDSIVRAFGSRLQTLGQEMLTAAPELKLLLCLEVGGWTLEVGSFGSWEFESLEVGSWKLGVGSWELEVGSWELGVEQYAPHQFPASYPPVELPLPSEMGFDDQLDVTKRLHRRFT